MGAWSRGRQRESVRHNLANLGGQRGSRGSKQGYQNSQAPNHHRNAECRRAPLTPYLLPGERLLHLRPRRMQCRSRPLRTRKSTTAVKCCSEVQAATLNRWMFTALRLCRCGLHMLHVWDPVFSKRRAASLFFFCGRQDIGGGRPSCHAVGCWRCRGTFRTGCCLVGMTCLFYLAQRVEDLKSHDCCGVRVRPKDRWAISHAGCAFVWYS